LATKERLGLPDGKGRAMPKEGQRVSLRDVDEGGGCSRVGMRHAVKEPRRFSSRARDEDLVFNYDQVLAAVPGIRIDTLQ